MQSLICVEPGLLEEQHKVPPVLTEGHAIIKIRRVGICGTDIHAYQGTQPYFSYPRILGHEIAADIIDIDGVTGFVIGEAVTVLPYLSCGHCIACANGKSNCCVNIKVLGVHVDGAMQQYLSVPVSNLYHGKGLSLDALALVEPFAVAAHALRKAAIRNREYVLVMGAGPIGLAIMKLAMLQGAKVIAMDLNDGRLDFCKKALGIVHCINPNSENAIQKLSALTGGDMLTVVIDATGNLTAIESGLNYLANGGRFILVGLQKESFSFSHPEFHKKETTLCSSRNALPEDFHTVIETMQRGAIPVDEFITHRMRLDELPEKIKSLSLPGTAVIKAMIEM